MKKLFLFILGICIATTGCKKKQVKEAAPEQTQTAGATYTAKAAPPANADILWYNNNAPEELMIERIKPSKDEKSGYELVEEDITAVWVADIKNGYIVTGGEGDGGWHTTIALYLSNTGVFIGKEHEYRGWMWYHSTLKFYEVKNTQWTDVTAAILPVTVDSFFDKDAIAKDWAVLTAALEKKQKLKIKNLSDLFTVTGELPRYGTDVKAGVVAFNEKNNPFIEIKHEGNKYNYTDSEIAAYERICAAAKKITLSWNMSTGKFDVKK